MSKLIGDILAAANLDILAKGGPLMILLGACSVLSLAIIIERMVNLRRAKVIRLDLLMEIEVALKNDELPEALEYCRRVDSSMMRITKVALINHEKPREEIKLALEEAGRVEVPVLEKFLTTLNTIAVITPLIGLLGTVGGMITVFAAIQAQGVGDINNLAGGISEALITTATGLTIAIPTLVFFNYYSRKVENMIIEMERHSLTLLDILVRSK